MSSPLFEGQEPINFSLPFSVPNTPVNQKILQYPGSLHFQKLPEENRFDFRLYYSGALLFSGILKIVSASHDTLELLLILSNARVLSQVREKYLTEIDLGGDRNIDPYYVTFEQIKEKFYPEVDYSVFPVEDTKFFDGTPFEDYYKEHFNSVNFYLQAYGFYFLNAPIVPFPYLGYVFERIFKTAGFDLVDNVFLRDPDLARLVIFNTFCSSTFKEDSEYLLDPPRVINLQNHVPFIKVADFLREMANLGILFFVNPQNSRVITRTIHQVFSNPTYLDFKLLVDANSIVVEFEPAKGLALSFAGDSSDDYLKSKTFDTSSLNYKGEVESVDDLPTENNQVNDCMLVHCEHAFYVWSWQAYDSTYVWIRSSDQLNPLYHGNREFSIDAACGSLVPDRGTSVYGQHTWIVPKTEQVGNCKGFPNFQSNAFSLRLLLYHGMKQNGGYEEYPFGSSHNFDYFNNKFGDLALTWHGQYGFYQKHWKSFLDWYLSGVRVMKFKAYGHIGDIKAIDLSRKYRYKNLQFFIRTIKINIELSSQITFEVEALLL
jgi:hypothetical protein